MQSGLHHLHSRKRIYQDLTAYPHPIFWKRILDYVMYVVAIVSPAALMPQIIQVYRTKDATGLSWETYSLFLVIDLLWVLYAIAHKEAPLAIASSLFAILDVALVYGIFLYG